MPNVVRTDIDALNAVITVTVPKSEYLSKVQQDIKQYSQRAQMKGFRPGKTPQTLVKKMYGNAFLMDAINEMVRKSLSDYMQDNPIRMIGEPIASLDQPKFNIDLKNPEDLEFKFDIGLLPEVPTINGLENSTYDRYVVQVDDAAVTEELNNVRKRASGEVEVEDTIQDEDLVTLELKEVGGTLEKDLMISTNWLTEDMKSVFLTQKQGDSLQINIFQLEKETTPQYVRKYFLGLEDTDTREVNELFDAKIKTVKRKVLAEMNEEFFTKNFGENITTEEQARQEISLMVNRNFDVQSDALVIRDIQDRIMAENHIQLPDEFVKRWLKTVNESNSDEIIEKSYQAFADQMKWTILRSKILNDAGINITQEDMKQNYANRVKGYLGNMAGNEDIANMLFERAMQEEKQYNEIYEDTMMEKFFEAVKLRANIVDKVVPKEELESKIAAARYEMAKNRGDIKEEEPIIEAAEIE